jgi:hypothetical protein
MAATKLLVILSEVSFLEDDSITGFGFCRPSSDRAIRAAIDAPPVMRMGAMGEWSIRDSLGSG